MVSGYNNFHDLGWTVTLCFRNYCVKILNFDPAQYKYSQGNGFM